MVQVVTGDSQEEVIIFRDKHTLQYNIYYHHDHHDCHDHSHCDRERMFVGILTNSGNDLSALWSQFSSLVEHLSAHIT